MQDEPGDHGREAGRADPDAASAAGGRPWTVSGVYLLTEASDGAVAVPELTMTFGELGIDVDRPDGERAWSRPWDEIEEMTPTDRSVLPGGGAGIVIKVVERAHRRAHRFVVPTDDPVGTEQMLEDLATDHGMAASVHEATPDLESGRGRELSRILTGAIVMAFVAVLTILLLSATHVIRL